MTFYIDTLGCKVNQYETQAMAALLEKRGHALAAEPRLAEARIINTCAVTGESGRKSRQAVRRAKRESPNAFIAVCGCFSQVSPDEVKALGADLIGGSGKREEFVRRLEELFSQRETVVDVDDPAGRRYFELLPSGSLSGRTRAMLKKQDGCCNFCSYCIIPYARGPVRSMPLEDVAEQSAQIARSGYKEIVLTGIEISSYGRDLEGDVSLIDAIRAVSGAAPGLRIRLGSLEPRTATEEFCRAAADVPMLCPHFHMSLQSGCDRTLRRMNRKYDSGEYYEYISNLRKHFPGCAVTTDVIVGFPGETEEDFEQSLAFLKKCAFAAVHVFPYSPHPGTPAAKMPEQIDKGEKHRRAAAAGELVRTLSRDYAEGFVLTDMPVLFEQEKDGFSYGHTPNYLTVKVCGTGLHNVVKRVHITGIGDGELCGIIQPGQFDISGDESYNIL